MENTKKYLGTTQKSIPVCDWYIVAPLVHIVEFYYKWDHLKRGVSEQTCNLLTH
jgi:hypothetical protein